MGSDANSMDRHMRALIKTYNIMLEDSHTSLNKMPIDIHDTSVHGDSFENLPSRQMVYNASRAFHNKGSHIGALRTMTTAGDMKGLEWFVTTMDTFVHELDRQNFSLVVNLRKLRETEHRLHAFILLKVSLNRVSNNLLILDEKLTEFCPVKCSAPRRG